MFDYQAVYETQKSRGMLQGVVDWSPNPDGAYYIDGDKFLVQGDYVYGPEGRANIHSAQKKWEEMTRDNDDRLMRDIRDGVSDEFNYPESVTVKFTQGGKGHFIRCEKASPPPEIVRVEGEKTYVRMCGGWNGEAFPGVEVEVFFVQDPKHGLKVRTGVTPETWDSCTWYDAQLVGLDAARWLVEKKSMKVQKWTVRHQKNSGYIVMS